MVSFNKLKGTCWNSKLVSFDNLPIGEYVVSAFSLVQTSFGPKVKADLGGKYVILPNRFADGMTSTDVENLNKVPQIMVYSGKNVTKRNK